MERSLLQNLIRKYYEGSLADTEHQQLMSAMETDEEAVKEAIAAELAEHEALPAFQNRNYDELIRKVMMVDNGEIAAEATHDLPDHKLRSLRRSWLKYAAAILLLFVAGYWYLNRQPEKQPQVVQTTPAMIAPGKDGAILTLSDGRELVIDSLGKGIIAMEDGAQVILKNGELQYSRLESGKKELQYNTMSTPRGRQFRITLPDGTEVWLNAASSIRFPVEFNSIERRVEVTGEAFFHVKSLNLPAFNGRPPVKVPFVVNVNNQLDVEVLGTQFNVNAYTNEQAIQTTLTEGVVRVRSLETNGDPSQTVVLLPGQQTSLKNNGSKKIIVQDADISKVIAWKNGLFNFENVSLADAMLQLERWYDIDVAYKNGIPDIWFSGKISRDLNLTDLLQILEKTGVQFRLEGRKLIVLRNN